MISSIEENRLVMTVTPQKLIWPHGRVYPRKPVAIMTRKIRTPKIHSTSRGSL